MHYIIEQSNGNNKILARQADGTYKSIAHCHGEFGNEEAQKMVEYANAGVNH